MTPRALASLLMAAIAFTLWLIISLLDVIFTRTPSDEEQDEKSGPCTAPPRPKPARQPLSPGAFGLLRIRCEQCGTKFRVSASAAGRHAKCGTCGSVFAIAPAHADEPVGAVSGAQDENEDTAARHPKRIGRSCPGCRAPLAGHAVLCVKCGYDTRTGARVPGVAASSADGLGHATTSQADITPRLGIQAWRDKTTMWGVVTLLMACLLWGVHARYLRFFLADPYAAVPEELRTVPHSALATDIGGRLVSASLLAVLAVLILARVRRAWILAALMVGLGTLRLLHNYVLVLPAEDMRGGPRAAGLIGTGLGLLVPWFLAGVGYLFMLRHLKSREYFTESRQTWGRMARQFGSIVGSDGPDDGGWIGVQRHRRRVWAAALGATLGIGLAGSTGILSAQRAMAPTSAMQPAQGSGAPAVARTAAPIDDRWSTMGTGINGVVNCLVVRTEDGRPVLYAGGSFTRAGGRACLNIARWDGSEWLPLGDGLKGIVRAMVVWESGPAPGLYVAGWFESGREHCGLMYWEGQVWHPVPNLIAPLHALVVFGDAQGKRLYVGGTFNEVGATHASAVACWDGRDWSDLDGGLTGWSPNKVSALEVVNDGHGSVLYAAGCFTHAGSAGTVVNHVARWDGRRWSALESGVGGGFQGGCVRTLFAHQVDGRPALGLVGDFGIAGQLSVHGQADWLGGAWRHLKAPDGAERVVDLSAGVLQETLALGNWKVHGVSQRQGTGWKPLGGGVSGSDDCAVHCAALLQIEGHTYVILGGQFSQAGHLATSGVAAYKLRQ